MLKTSHMPFFSAIQLDWERTSFFFKEISLSDLKICLFFYFSKILIGSHWAQLHSHNFSFLLINST
jgi:hypothetical protein